MGNVSQIATRVHGDCRIGKTHKQALSLLRNPLDRVHPVPECARADQ